MHLSAMQFLIEHIAEEEIRGKRVLEVGSKYVNGSIRPFVERFEPKEYVGVDIERGRYVDVVLPVERLRDCFKEESFDMIIATELLEHVRDRRMAVENIKTVLTVGGSLYITTRSYGFPFHAYPHDFWRFEDADIKAIFPDFVSVKLMQDPESPGVFFKGSKSRNKPANLSSVALYSMVMGKRTTLMPSINDMPYARRMKVGFGKLMGQSYLLMRKSFNLLRR